jgi:adenylate cyclase
MSFWRRLSPLRIAVLVGLVTAAVRFGGCRFLDLADVRSVDYRLLQRGELPATGEVVIVAVDDASLEEVGEWPWSRALIAKLIDRLVAADAAVIGFDVVYSVPSAERIPGRLDDGTGWGTADAEDALLVEAVRASQRTVLGYYFEVGGAAPKGRRIDGEKRQLATYNVVQPSRSGRGESSLRLGVRLRDNLPAMTEAARQVGFFNAFPDAGDAVRRRVPMAMRFESEIAIPLSLAMLRARWPERPLLIRFADEGVDEIRFGDRFIPVDEDGQLLINYRGRGRTLPHVSVADLLAGRVPAEKLRNKLVLVGVTAAALADVDIVVTPFGPMAGVELQANVLDNLLAGDFIAQPRVLIVGEILAIFLFTFALGLGMQWARGWTAAALWVGLLMLYLVGSQWYFLRVGLPLGIVYPLLAVSFAYSATSLQQYLTEERDKRKLRTALEMYVSRPLARLVSEQPEQLKLGGDRRDCTVLFLDIRDFTRVSEEIEVTLLVDVVNGFFAEMTEVVFSNDGMLDKYLGDGIMAIWGALIPQPDHAARACAAALRMIERLGEVTPAWTQRGWPALSVGIGLSSGPMAVGNMGSTQHLSYTAVGDNVNLGARLEDLTKFYRTRILASEATASAAPNVVTRELDLVRVKGRVHPVRIFEVLGPAHETASWQIALERFAAGLAHYRARRWREALDEFRELLAEHPGDGPARCYIQRCQRMLIDPPPSDWDAITTFATKEGE